MPWQETSKGHFRRALGENEIFIRLICDGAHPIGRQHWTTNAISSFTPHGSLPSDNPTALGKQMINAWKLFRFRHPGIASTIDESDRDFMQYEVPTPAALDAWASKTFVIVQDTSDADEVVAHLKPEPYTMLHFLPASNTIVLSTSHWRTDGMGIWHMLNEYYKCLIDAGQTDVSKLPWGTEPPRLLPSVEEALSLPSTSTPALEAEAHRCHSTFIAVPNSVGPAPRPDAAVAPGNPRNARLSLDTRATAAVVAACKQKGVSVTSAVHAALAAANYACALPGEGQKGYTSTVRFTLRPHLPEQLRGAAGAAGLYTTGWMDTVPPGRDVLEYARYYQDVYASGLSETFLAAHRFYADKLGDMVRNKPKDAPPSATNVDVSSMGVAEKYVDAEHGDELRGVSVRSVSLGVELLSRNMVCYLWTFRGCMQWNMVYNEAFHTEEGTARFLGVMKGILGEALEVEL